MRKLLFIVAFLFVGVSFADSDSLDVNSSKDNPNYKIVNGIGKESKIDSVVRTEEEVLIYIDGVKTPVIQKDAKIYPVPVPVPSPSPKDTISSDTSSVSGSTKAVTTKNASVIEGLGFLPFLLGLFGIGFLAAGIISGKNKESKSGDGDGTSEAVAPDNNTPNPADPVTVAPVPENRFVPAIDADYAPAYRTGNTSISRGEVPELVERAYSNTPNFVSQHGNVSNVRDVKFGKLNGRFRMEHSDGNVSVQQFNNEPGFKATATLEGGLNVFIYSRFGCMNNVKALRLAEVSEEPTFTETTEETVGSATVTTEFQPEPVPSEIVEVPTPEAPAPAVETPVPVAEVATASSAVPAEELTTAPEPIATTDDDPVVTATINGKQVTARLSTVKEFLK